MSDAWAARHGRYRRHLAMISTRTAPAESLDVPRSHQGSGAEPRLALVHEEQAPAPSRNPHPTSVPQLSAVAQGARDTIHVLPSRSYFLRRPPGVVANRLKSHHAVVVSSAKENEATGLNFVELATLRLGVSIDTATWALVGGLSGWATGGFLGLALDLTPQIWAPASAAAGAVAGAFGARFRWIALFRRDHM